MWNEWTMGVCRQLCGGLVAAAVLPGCYAEDTIEYACEERGRSPAVLVPGEPAALTLQLSCEDELTLAQWDLLAQPSSLGPPSGGASLTADRTTGRDFTLTGNFTPESYWRLDELEIRATDDRGVRDIIVMVDWEHPP